MKRKNKQNTSGVEICDSIVMSVKKKRIDLRKPAAVLIAVIGFTSVIMSFLSMFEFRYYSSVLFTSAVIISLFYIITSVIAKRALWLYSASVIVFAVSAFRKIKDISLGFKFVYNVIYSTSFHTNIKYYKLLEHSLERDSITTLFFFYIWLLAIVVYFFTICRPNPIIPLLITFPVIEIGLYNGIELSVFWGILVIAYWLSLLAMSTIDVGEYSGGQGGFVRKNNLFFPKRQMKLKVTEKCGIFIIASVMLTSFISMSVIRLTGYERSDEINEKRRNISEAMDSFTIDDLAESLANVSNAFGFKFTYENHKLGTSDKIRYKNTTDLSVTFDGKIDGAVYLKNYSGSVYSNNEWSDLPASAYNDSVFSDFKNYGIYPQDFPCLFSKLIDPQAEERTIWIKSKLKNDKSFAPYGTDNFGTVKYQNDLTVSDKNSSNKDSSFKFMHIDSGFIADSIGFVSRNVYSADDITDRDWKDKILGYCEENNLTSYGNMFPVDYEISAEQDVLYSNGKTLMAELLQNSYKDFVYSNYLQIPDDKNIREVKTAYSEILSGSDSAKTASDKYQILLDIRDKMNSEVEYSLSPGKTPSNRDFVNYFLLENNKGYCIHYATSGVLLARMAGIPARYATGYILVGSDFNPDTQNRDGTYTIDVKDNRSHAWTEVYLDGFGWIPFEFTAGYSASEINTNPTTTTAPPTEVTTTEDSSETTDTTNSRTTRQRNTSRTTRLTTTTTAHAGTTAASTTKNGYGIGFGKGNGKKLPAAVKNAINFVLFLIAVILLIIARRIIILKIRSGRFNKGKLSRRIGYIYSYTERLLAVIKLQNEQMQFVDFANQVEQRIGGDYFENGAFSAMTDCALKSAFSNSEADEKEIILACKTAESLAENIYKRSNPITKLRLKFIDVLI